MTEKMTALTLSGPVEQLDEVIVRFVVGREFHLEDSVSFLAPIHKLKPFTEQDPYAASLTEARRLLSLLKLKPRHEAFEDKDFTLESSDDFLQKVSQRLESLEAERAALTSQIQANREAERILSHFVSVPVRTRELVDPMYVRVRFGRVPAKRWAGCSAEFENEAAEMIVRADEDGIGVWCVATALPESADRMEAVLARHGFERALPNPAYVGDWTAAEELETIRAKCAADEVRIGEIERELAAVETDSGEELLERFSYLKYRSACFGVRASAAQGHGRFYLVGWTPAVQAEAFEREYEKNSGFICTMLGDAKLPTEPPVKLSQNKVASVFTPLLKMYGLPGYGETDPRFLMAVTYTLFFGIMFGDAGQGLCLALLGFLLYRRKKSWLWRVVGICGCSSVVFGLIYGSVFGFEELLPWGGFHPLESENIMTLLLIAVAVGIVVLLICMVLNMVNDLRKHDIHGALFSPSGLCGAIFYVAALGAIAGGYTGKITIGGAYIVCLLVMPLVLIWIGEPLSKLLQGRRDWKPKSVGMFLAESFFDIFEALLGYMSNTLSFLRLGAFAISHAGMMMVVFLLSENAAATGRIVTIVLGNLFVAGLEAALSSIQIIRLEFYEMFGRFNSGSGRAFQPVTVEYN